MNSDQDVKPNEQFEIRDMRDKSQYSIDDKFLNGYARVVGVYGVAVYNSLCRHADKSQTSWPSIDRLAEELAVSRQSIVNGLDNLEACHIIKRIRVGRTCNNRYILMHKNSWHLVGGEVSQSEVHQIDFSSLPRRLHQSTTQTSNSKDTHSKEKTHSKDCRNKKSCDRSVNDYLKEMETDKNRHIQIITLYFKHKSQYFNFQNIDQVLNALNRELRPARNLTGYTDDQIQKTMYYLDSNKDVNFIRKWSLETVGKYIDYVKALPANAKKFRSLIEIARDLGMDKGGVSAGDRSDCSEASNG